MSSKSNLLLVLVVVQLNISRKAMVVCVRRWAVASSFRSLALIRIPSNGCQNRKVLMLRSQVRNSNAMIVLERKGSSPASSSCEGHSSWTIYEVVTAVKIFLPQPSRATISWRRETNCNRKCDLVVSIMDGATLHPFVCCPRTTYYLRTWITVRRIYLLYVNQSYESEKVEYSKTPSTWNRIQKKGGTGTTPVSHLRVLGISSIRSVSHNRASC